jgi:hypothetical protein
MLVDTDNLILVKEWAQREGWSIEHCQLLMRRGKLPGVKIRRFIFIDKRHTCESLGLSKKRPKKAKASIPDPGKTNLLL